jgi:serine phosphatase RsbU (regulator of sigma subunit)
MFGTPRMEGFVGAHPGGAALIDTLLAELERFTGEQWEQEDDITLLTLEVPLP